MIRDIRITLAFVFGLIGGILIFVSAVVFLQGLLSPYSYGSYVFGPTGIFVGFISGILVIIGTTLGFVRPQQGVTAGIVVVVFGSFSFVVMGGYLIGMALAITGGALLIVVGATGPASATGGQRACLGCGMLTDRDFAHCPHCGYAMPPLPH